MKNLQILLSLSMLFLISTMNGQSSSRVEAPNAKSVVIADKGSSNSIGNFQEMSSGLWQSSINGQSTSYKELNRDQWSIYLKVSNTNQNVMLNLWTKKVLFDGVEKYAVLEASADAIPIESAKRAVATTPAVTDSNNLGKGKPSKQSSVLDNAERYGAQYANDGILQTTGGSTIACTKNEANPWWEVDLQGYFDIKNIVLHNRTNCCPDRLGNFTILVSVHPFTGNSGGTTFIANQPAPNGKEMYFSTGGKAVGRYVRIFLNQTNYLSIPEIEIAGVFAMHNDLIAAFSGTTPAATPVATTTVAATTVAATTPASPTWNFQSGSNLPLEISANGKVIGTLKLYGKVQSLPVGIGDEITVRVIEEGQKANRNKLGYPPITINDGTENPLKIVVKPAYTYDDQRTGLRDDYIVNFRGVDLTKFEPFNVGDSFTGRKIFDGLRIGTYMYEQLDDGAYVPTGFTNTGKINSGAGNYTEKTIQSQDKMKEAWSVGASVGAEIPLDPVGLVGVVAKNKVSFNYGESEVENSSESDVFITSSDRKVIYNLEIENLDRVILTLDFIQDVQSIESIADAHEVVARYGTHYADKVNYGGQYHTMIRIHEDAYYTANTKDWDLTTDIKLSKSGEPETVTRQPNNAYDRDEGYTDTKGGGGGSSGVGGTFSFSSSKAESHEEVYGNIASEYWYAGGTGNIDSWTADENNAVAVQVGNLIYISELVKPNIFKTALTESDLKPKRDLLKKAIELKLKDMKYLEMPKPYRSFHYRIKSIEYVHYNDDANTRIKGKIAAHILDNGKEVETKTLWERKDWVEDNTGGLTDRKELSLVRNSLDKNKWVVGRQEGIYVGTGVDAKTEFKPLQIKFSGSITEKDDCCFNTGHDVLNIKGDHIMTIKDSGKRDFYTFELDHFYTHVEKMRLKVTIELVPLIGF